ncbi:hypothetical protein GYMLUDRAFT_45692 [Collybiopsis luxurians FD-317 M1]|uniref:Uncharacterized protein n=1 Tax=Collybiopsis luxurians FD-317 M1 TaxID=944289 RepID=A0A0D0CQT5_9AGAR|nr:hypothetical protein GYMLUDRAFT_45692 [Collybiopsis luxurians FD-317 M1]
MAPLTRARARASETGIRTPVRRSDSDSHHILPNIPAEIFLEIANYIFLISNHLEYESIHSTDIRNRRIHDSSTLLSPTDKAFGIEFPILGVDGGGKSFIPFCKSLAVGQVNAKLLAPHVRSCVLEDYRLTGIPLPKAASTLFKTHVNALPAMSSLSALVLSRVPFTPRTHPFLSESVTELCMDRWVFMRSLMNSSFSGGPPTTLSPLQTLRLHFLFETLTALLIDVVCCPKPVAGNADPYTLSLLHLPHLRSLACPPHMAYHLSGTHSLSQLTFNTRLRLASPDEKSFFCPRYRGIEELALPYMHIMEVKEVKNEENKVGGDGAASSSSTDGGEGSSSSRGTTKVACRAKSTVETLAPELQLKRLMVIENSGCVIGRREFETVSRRDVFETLAQLTELRFVNLVFEDFSAPSPPSFSSSASSSSPMFTPTAKRDGSVPLLAHPPSSMGLSLFTPTPAQTLSHLIELNAEDGHKDIVHTRCFPALERLVFVGMRVGAGRRVVQGGGVGGGVGGGGGGEGGNPVDGGRVCLGSSQWSWVWRRDGGADRKQWRLVDEGDESDD